MKKKALLAVSGTLVVILLALVGLFLYTNSQKEKLALRSNLKELVYLENLENYKEEISTSSNIILDIAGNEQTIPATDKYSIEVDVLGDKAVVTNMANESQTITIEEYKAMFSPVNDYDIWEEIINDGDFTAGDTTYMDMDAWEFTINDKRITDDYLNTLKTSFATQLTPLFLAQGIEVESTDVIFHGDLEFVIIIDKEEYQLRYAKVTASEDILVGVNATLEGQSLPISVNVNDFAAEFTVSEFELGGLAASLPMNPVTLWLGSM